MIVLITNLSFDLGGSVTKSKGFSQNIIDPKYINTKITII